MGPLSGFEKANLRSRLDNDFLPSAQVPPWLRLRESTNRVSRDRRQPRIPSGEVSRDCRALGSDQHHGGVTMNRESNLNDRPLANDDLLTIREVAAIVRAPIATLRYWRHLGAGPRSFRLGRRVVYRVADLRAWIDAQAGASDAGAAVSQNG